MKNNAIVLAHLIGALDIPVTKQTIDEELHKHPDLYSLLALSDVLNNFQISNAAYHVKFEELREVPCPFVAYVSKKDFLLIHGICINYVTVSNERWSKHRLSIEKFKEIYSGSILVAEKTPMSGEPGFSIKRRREIINILRRPMCVACACLVVAFILLRESNFIATLAVPLLMLTFVKTLGVFISVLLLIQSVDANNCSQ